jgi:hypothetical protein
MPIPSKGATSLRAALCPTVTPTMNPEKRLAAK